jgi:hypothetical protein
VGVVLAGYLLLGRQNRLDGAEVDVDHSWIGSLLDDTGDDVAFSPLEFAENVIVCDVPQALVDHLLCRKRSDSTEVAWAVLGFSEDVSVFVMLGHPNYDVPSLAVEFDSRRHRFARFVICATGVLEVCGEYRLLDDLHKFFEGDLTFALHEAQHAQVNVH